MTYQIVGEVTNIRSSAILTTSYVASEAKKIDGASQVNLLVQLRRGSLTSIEITPEFSPDNSTWFRETSEAVSGGTISEFLTERSFTGDGNYSVPIPTNSQYFRVQAKGTGTTTNSWLKVDVVDSSF